MLSDLRFALRQLMKSPGFAAIAVITLALGLGVNTTILSLLNANLIHPLSYPDSGRLVRIWARNPSSAFNGPYVSWPRFQYYREHATSFAGLAATRPLARVFGEGREAERIEALTVSAGFFPLLGQPLALGRNFTTEEDVPNGPPVIIVSYGYWQTKLGGHPDVIGRTLRLDGTPCTIVGVTNEAFGYPWAECSFFSPGAWTGPDRTPEQVQAGSSYLNITGRLKPGVSLEQAGLELAGLNADYIRSHPGNTDVDLTNRLRPYSDELVGAIRPALILLAGAVGLVLVIACANVSSLFLGRLSGRSREIAVRLSLGASRRHLLRQFFLESLVFSLAAAGLGVLFSAAAQMAVTRLAAGQLPHGAGFGFDPLAIVGTVLLALLTALFISAFPAFQISRVEITTAARDGARGSSQAQGTRFRSSLIVGEVALALVLLCTAALLYTSFQRLQRTPPGFQPAGVASALVVVPVDHYRTRPAQAEFIERILARLRADPRITHAGATLGLPLTGITPVTDYGLPGRPANQERLLAGYRLASDDFFPALGMTLRAGRAFTVDDKADAPPVCIINDSFARRLFPNGNAIGEILLTGASVATPTEIVGVVADVKSIDLAAAAPDEIYFPLGQRGGQYVNVVVRTTADPRSLQPLFRDAVAAEHPGLPISWFQTMTMIMAQSLARQNLIASLASSFAVLALALSAVGLYSVLSYMVTLRTHEIGIRMALGARPARVVALVLGQGLRLIALGLAAGLVASAGLGQLIHSLLFATAPLDPVIYGGVTLLFLGTGLLACLVPAARAARTDPMVALRAE